MIPGLAAVAAFGLRTEHELPRSLSDEQYHRLLNACEQHRVLGMLASSVRTGALPVSSEQADELEQRLRAWLTHDVRVEHMLLQAVRALDGAGIESRVLKGVALAHTVYDDPADRVFGDVDLLVPDHHLSRAAAVVTSALDGTRPLPEVHRNFDDRFGKEVMLKVAGLELDLHRTFVEGAYGLTVNLADLFAPPYRFALGIVELEALPQPQRFLHACYAAALGDWPPRLVSLRDVAQILLRERPHVIDVLLMARAWECEAVVAHAVASAWAELSLLETPPLVGWARNYEPNRTERLLLASHQGSARSFTRHIAALWVVPGLSEKVAYARSVALPQRSYLQARGLSVWGHVGRAWRRIRLG